MAEITWKNINDAGQNTALNLRGNAVGHLNNSVNNFTKVGADAIDMYQLKQRQIQEEASRLNTGYAINQLHQVQNPSQLNTLMGTGFGTNAYMQQTFGADLNYDKFNSEYKTLPKDVQDRAYFNNNLKDFTPENIEQRSNIAQAIASNDTSKAQELLGDFNGSNKSVDAYSQFIQGMSSKDRDYNATRADKDLAQQNFERKFAHQREQDAFNNNYKVDTFNANQAFRERTYNDNRQSDAMGKLTDLISSGNTVKDKIRQAEDIRRSELSKLQSAFGIEGITDPAQQHEYAMLYSPAYAQAYNSIGTLNQELQSISQMYTIANTRPESSIAYPQRLANTYLNNHNVNPNQYDQHIIDTVAKYAGDHKYVLDPAWIKAQIRAESNFNPNARSSVGASGLSQFMPATAKEYGIDPSNPEQSIDGQVRYMYKLLDMFKGDKDLALAAYNAGQGNVQKYGGIPPFKETQDYVNRINGYIEESNGYAGANRANSLDDALGVNNDNRKLYDIENPFSDANSNYDYMSVFQNIPKIPSNQEETGLRSTMLSNNSTNSLNNTASVGGKAFRLGGNKTNQDTQSIARQFRPSSSNKSNVSVSASGQPSINSRSYSKEEMDELENSINSMVKSINPNVYAESNESRNIREQANQTINNIGNQDISNNKFGEMLVAYARNGSAEKPDGVNEYTWAALGRQLQGVNNNVNYIIKDALGGKDSNKLGEIIENYTKQEIEDTILDNQKLTDWKAYVPLNITDIISNTSKSIENTPYTSIDNFNRQSRWIDSNGKVNPKSEAFMRTFGKIPMEHRHWLPAGFDVTTQDRIIKAIETTKNPAFVYSLVKQSVDSDSKGDLVNFLGNSSKTGKILNNALDALNILNESDFNNISTFYKDKLSRLDRMKNSGSYESGFANYVFQLSLQGKDLNNLNTESVIKSYIENNSVSGASALRRNNGKDLTTLERQSTELNALLDKQENAVNELRRHGGDSNYRIYTAPRRGNFNINNSDLQKIIIYMNNPNISSELKERAGRFLENIRKFNSVNIN